MAMKVGVSGSGLMGKEAARDLLNSKGVSTVGLADVDIDRAQRVCEDRQSTKLTVQRVNANHREELANYMKQYDGIINALFYSFNDIVAQTAIEVGVSSVDLGGHIGSVTDDVLKLHDDARGAHDTLIPDLAVAPRMRNVLS